MHPRIAAVWANGRRAVNAGEFDPPKAHDVLAVLNAHPRDKGIGFREHDHFYGIHNPDTDTWVASEFLTSVTGVVKPFVHPFPAFTIAGNIAKKQRRLTEEMYDQLSMPHPNVKGLDIEYTEEQHAAARAAKDPLKLYRYYGELVIHALPAALRAKFFDETFGEYAGLTSGEEVQKHWQRGTQFGTDFHQDVELHINGFPPLMAPGKPWAQYQAFRAERPDMVFYRTEWRIYCTHLLLTGTIDAAVVAERDAEGRVAAIDIYDWKTNKDVHGANSKDKKKCFLPPLQHLTEDKKTTQGVQLNLYKHLIEKAYGLRVRRMYIVAFHDNYDTFQLIDIPDMTADLAILLKAHMELLLKRLG